MLSITVGADYGSEKSYAAEVIFGQILGVDVNISVMPGKVDTEIVSDNGTRLIIKDSFAFMSSDGCYMRLENVPQKIVFIKNDFIAEGDLPVIFGDADLAVSEDCIVCGIDVLASVYFMLTRWEEYVNPVRDREGRFPGSASAAFKNGFLHRPVVNEYAEMLWNMLMYLGFKQPRRECEFVMKPTHDVDRVYYPFNLTYLGGDVLRTRSLLNPLKRLYAAATKRNYWDTFRYLMDRSEQYGVKSIFYFLAKRGATAADYNLSDPFVRAIVSEIKERGHDIGAHLSKESIDDLGMIRQEKSEVEDLCAYSVTDIRRHFLLFRSPVTWQMHQDAGFKVDSTVGYHDQPGFRCGTGMEFPTFNFLTGKKMEIHERPLLFMDGSLYRPGASSDELSRVRNVLVGIIASCKKYGMPCTLLFHNSSFDPIRWPGWGELYDTILK